MLANLKSRLKDSQNFYHSKLGELQSLEKEIKIKENEIQNLSDEQEKLMIEKKLIENACMEAREQGRQFLEEVATLAVSSVFQDDTKVKLILDEKGDNPILEVRVTQKDENGVEQIINPTFDGGGLSDVLSLCFFISIGSTVEDNFAPYILDEPSKFVSKGELADNFASYMKNIVSFTNKQIIMSTHDESMSSIGDTKYTIIKDKETKVSNVVKDY